MSGTTITAEERAQWLSEAQPKNIDYYEPIDFELDKRIRKLIGALEQAEASAEKAEAEDVRLQQRVNDLLSEELTDGAVRERIQLRFNMHEVLQQNERLTKERDWLAEACAEHCHDKCGDDARCSFVGCEPVHCNHATTDQWKEAARRAVAAGEEICQK